MTNPDADVLAMLRAIVPGFPPDLYQDAMTGKFKMFLTPASMKVLAAYATTLRDEAVAQRDAEIARQKSEIASLRLTLGGRTFSAAIPEPIGCPMPGACAQVAEIARLTEAVENKDHACREMLAALDRQFGELARLRDTLVNMISPYALYEDDVDLAKRLAKQPRMLRHVREARSALTHAEAKL